MAGVKVTALRLSAREAEGRPRAVGPVRRAFLGARVEDELAAPRVRGVGELLDAATHAYAAHFALCFGVAMAVWLPFQVLSELFARAEVWLGSLLLATTVAMPARFLCTGFVGCFVVDRLLGREGRAGRAAGRALAGAAPLVQAAVVVGLVTVLLFCMCVLPVFAGIWLFSLAPIVAVLERPSVLEGLRRSIYLAQGWDYLGRWLAALLVGAGLFLPATLLLGAVHEAGVRAFLETSLGARGVAFDLVIAALSACFLALSGAFTGVLSTVLYVDARVRREGLDLEVQLERLVARRTERMPA